MRRRKGPPQVTVEASVEADGSVAVNKPQVRVTPMEVTQCPLTHTAYNRRRIPPSL